MVSYRVWDEFPHHRIGDDGSVWSRRTRTGKLSEKFTRLTGTLSRGGYIQYCILDKDDKPRSIKGHQLVLSAFRGPCPENGMGCHADGNPRNNRLENLYWGTAQTNQDDRIRHGRSCRGESNTNSKLTTKQVKEIKAKHSKGKSFRGLAREYGVDKATIGRACKGITWKEVADVA